MSADTSTSILEHERYLFPVEFTYGQAVQVSIGFYQDIYGRVRGVSFQEDGPIVYLVELQVAGDREEARKEFPGYALKPVEKEPAFENRINGRYTI